jgi:hypothetical protein
VILENLSYDKVSDFIAENNEIGFLSEGQLNLQALVNFQDYLPEDGGFHIVPGMPQKFVEWTNSREKLNQRYKCSTFVVLPQ